MQADNLVVVSVKVREAFSLDSLSSLLNKTRAVPVYSHSLSALYSSQSQQ